VGEVQPGGVGRNRAMLSDRDAFERFESASNLAC
jgi:hypothetical protein